MIKKLNNDSFNSMESNPKSIFILFFSDIWIDIKSLSSFIFFLSENNLSPKLLPISFIVIKIFFSSDFFIISKLIPSMNNLHILISSLAKINSNFEKLKLILTFVINFIIFSSTGLFFNFSFSIFPLKYLFNSFSVYTFSSLVFSSAVNSFFSSDLFPPKKNEKALANTFPFLLSKIFCSVFSFVFFIKFISFGINIFSLFIEFSLLIIFFEIFV